jgi:hypothetical protein
MAATSATSPSEAAAASQAAAASYQRQQAAIAAAAVIGAVKAWRAIDGKALDHSWIGVLGRMLGVISGAQRKAAAAAPGYLERVLKAQNVATSADARLLADAFAGLTGDGRSLAGLLYAPVALSKQRIGQGDRIASVLGDEEKHIALLARTVTQDAGRMALQTAMAAEPKVRGYVRQVTLPACARCIILSGRFYRYTDGFLRHPNCDCTMIPAAGERFVEAANPAELIGQMQREYPARLRRSLTEGDLKALDHGADLNQVVNAHRGMATAAGPGRRVSVTSEGTTVRGIAGKRLAAEAGTRSGGRYRTARAPRLTPAQVFAEASRNGWGEAEIVRQLTRFGYIIGDLAA